jgi:hypothetical protein
MESALKENPEDIITPSHIPEIFSRMPQLSAFEFNLGEEGVHSSDDGVVNFLSSDKGVVKKMTLQWVQQLTIGIASGLVPLLKKFSFQCFSESVNDSDWHPAIELLIAALASQCPLLEELEMTKSCIGDRGIMAIVRAMPSLPKLKSIDTSYNFCTFATDDPLRAFTEALRNDAGTSLERVQFETNIEEFTFACSPDARKELATVFREGHCPNLRDINIPWCEEDGCDAFYSYLNQGPAGNDHSRIFVDESGMVQPVSEYLLALAEGQLPNKERFEYDCYLSLDGHLDLSPEIRLSHSKLVASAICGMSGLQQLLIGSSWGGAGGWTQEYLGFHLAAGLAQHGACPNLKELQIIATLARPTDQAVVPFGDEFFVALVDSFAANPRKAMTTLQIRGGTITDHGASRLALELNEALPRLEWLDLQGNEITDAGFTFLEGAASSHQIPLKMFITGMEWGFARCTGGLNFIEGAICRDCRAVNSYCGCSDRMRRWSVQPWGRVPIPPSQNLLGGAFLFMQEQYLANERSLSLLPPQ